MATSLGIDPLQLLASIVGQQTQTDQSRTDAETATQNQQVASTSTQQQSGSTQQQGSTTGQVSGQSSRNQTTQNTANVADLTALMTQQRQGLTPEALRAIFTQGAEGMPNVIAAYSNAVGASTGGNTGVQTALEGMMGKILQTAALSQQAGVNSAAETAARIAQLTSGSTVSGTDTNLQSSSQTQNQVGTSQQTTTGSQNQQVTGNTSRQANIGTSTDQSTSVDDSRVLGLLGLLLGGGVLNSGLNQAGLGGLAGAVGSGVNAAGGGIAQLLQMLGIGNADTAVSQLPGNQSLAGGGFDLASLLGGNAMTDQQIGDILNQLPEFSVASTTDPLQDFWRLGTSGD